MEVTPFAETDVVRHVIVANEKCGGGAVGVGGPSGEDEEDGLDQALGRPEEPQDGVVQVKLLKEEVSHSDGQIWPGPVSILGTLPNLSHPGM